MNPIEQAIESLESYVTTIATAGGGDKQLFMAAIRQADDKARAALIALREAVKQEPLFYYRPVCNGEMYEGPMSAKSIGGKIRMEENPGEWLPLFGAPQAPKAEPVLLSDAEIDAITAAQWGDRVFPAAYRAYARAVEAEVIRRGGGQS